MGRLTNPNNNLMMRRAGLSRIENREYAWREHSEYVFGVCPILWKFWPRKIWNFSWKLALQKGQESLSSALSAPSASSSAPSSASPLSSASASSYHVKVGIVERGRRKESLQYYKFQRRPPQPTEKEENHQKSNKIWISGNGLSLAVSF